MKKPAANGRMIDLLVTNDDGAEISSNEWKKRNISAALLFKQQTKSSSLIYLPWSGEVDRACYTTKYFLLILLACLFPVRKVDGVYAATHQQKLVIPKHP